MAEYQCDACFLACPLPILKAQKILRQIQSGDRLTVLVSDTEQVSEFKFYCKNTDISIINSSKLPDKVQNMDIWQIVLQK